MTPTEQEKKLREQIADALRTGYHGIAETKVINRVLELITADRKRVELEARIDELENRLRVQFIPSHWVRLCAEVNSWAKYVDRRIAELKAQQEEV